MIQLAFLGAGRMASAMVQGIIQKGHYKADQMACTSGSGETATHLAKQTGIRYIPNLEKLLADAQVITLACKPQQLSTISPTIKHYVSGRLVLSVLAGIPIDRLAKELPGAKNYVRAMPNIPGQIGAGITGFASKYVLPEQEKMTVESILSALGKIIYLPENQLDAVTALSGSGPAYVFEFIAALREGGINAGLPPKVASLLALETTLGAARFLDQSGKEPEKLRDQVTSPGGTTFAGLKVMEKQNFRQMLNHTIQAAKNRSIELAQI